MNFPKYVAYNGDEETGRIVDPLDSRRSPLRREGLAIAAVAARGRRLFISG